MSKKKNFCVYKITNIINDKVYIGKTLADTTRRWADHRNVAALLKEDKVLDKWKFKIQVIHKAMVKYGIDNFQFEILKYYQTEEQAYAGEVKIIAKYDSYRNGYNSTPGGRGGEPIRSLNPQQIKEVFEDYVYNNLSSLDISKKYKISKPCILLILKGKTYLSVNISDYLRYYSWLKIHRPKNGSKRLNQDAKFVKIKEQDVKNIFKEFIKSKDPLLLHKKYNISHANIIQILNRKSWKFVKIHPSIAKRALEKLESFRKVKQKSKKEQLEIKQKIFEMHIANYSKEDILKKVDISKDLLNRILNGSYWENIILPLHLQNYL